MKISYKEFIMLCRSITEEYWHTKTSGYINDGGYLLTILSDVDDVSIEIYLKWSGISDYDYCTATVEFDIHLKLDTEENIAQAERITKNTLITAKKLYEALKDCQIDFDEAWKQGHLEQYEWNTKFNL